MLFDVQDSWRPQHVQIRQKCTPQVWKPLVRSYDSVCIVKIGKTIFKSMRLYVRINRINKIWGHSRNVDQSGRLESLCVFPKIRAFKFFPVFILAQANYSRTFQQLSASKYLEFFNTWGKCPSAGRMFFCRIEHVSRTSVGSMSGTRRFTTHALYMENGYDVCFDKTLCPGTSIVRCFVQRGVTLRSPTKPQPNAQSQAPSWLYRLGNWRHISGSVTLPPWWDSPCLRAKQTARAIECQIHTNREDFCQSTLGSILAAAEFFCTT